MRKIFEVTLQSFIKYILGYGTNQGILGEVDSYYGTKESQGRFSLHGHMLVWVMCCLVLHEIQTRLRNQTFREQFAAYVDSVMSASW